MFIETLDSFPEEMRGDFVETEMDGKKGYMHKTDEPLLNSLKNAKAEREKYRTDAEDAKGRLTNIEKEQQTKIQQARAEALEQARSKGDVSAVEERYQQQMADLEKRSGETLKERDDRIEKLSGTLKSRERSLLASKLANELANDAGRDLFTDVVQSRIDVDLDTGKTVFLNADGSASSLDLDGFKKEIEADSRLAPLLKSRVVTTGGGLVNGSNGTGSASFSKGNLGGSREERKAAIAKRFNL